MAQLKDRLFHGMTDKLRDSVRYLFTNPTVDFNQLLKAAMTCEIEAASRQVTKAKAMQFSEGVPESPVVNSEINSIHSQLEQMSTILKGANFNGTKDNNNGKKNDGYHKQKVDGRQGLKGPRTSAAGPFCKDKPPVQCYQCMGWGLYGRNCPNEYPVEGSVNWENLHGEAAKQGGTLPQQGNATQTKSQTQNSNPINGSARAITSTISKTMNKGVFQGEGMYKPQNTIIRIHLSD